MANKSDSIFKIQHQYELYLQRINLSESIMHPEQKKQIKQAFFGAWGQLIILMRDEIAILSEDDGVDVLDGQIDEVANYFLSITGQNN